MLFGLFVMEWQMALLYQLGGHMILTIRDITNRDSGMGNHQHTERGELNRTVSYRQHPVCDRRREGHVAILYWLCHCVSPWPLYLKLPGR